MVAVPLLHDTPDAMANPHGVVRDWKAGECEPVPGVTMPKLVEVERDYGAVADKMSALGPLMDTLGATTKGVTFDVTRQVDYLRPRTARCAAARPTAGPRSSATSSVRGDPRAVRHDQRTPRDPGLQDSREADRDAAADLAEEHEGKQITFADTQGAPCR